jgi:hypothetical protein
MEDVLILSMQYSLNDMKMLTQEGWEIKEYKHDCVILERSD